MTALHSSATFFARKSRAGGFSKVVVGGCIVAAAAILLGTWSVLLNDQAVAAGTVPTPVTADPARAPVIAPAAAAAAPPPHFADFGLEKPSPEVRQLADWVADSRDNGGMAFIIVDKKNASVNVFDPGATLQSSSPVLIGSAIGDDSFPGIGSRPIAQVKPFERTTPAGRFIAERGRNATGEDVIWVDYDAAVSMHRVRANNAKERRLERLATPTADDNRISYGCINVPVVFYERFIRPIFATHRALVYVLPESKSAQLLFGSYDVATKHGLAPR